MNNFDKSFLLNTTKNNKTEEKQQLKSKTEELPKKPIEVVSAHFFFLIFFSREISHLVINRK